MDGQTPQEEEDTAYRNFKGGWNYAPILRDKIKKFRVPVVAQWLANLTEQVRSLALLSELKILCCCGCGTGLQLQLWFDP